MEDYTVECEKNGIWHPQNDTANGSIVLEGEEYLYILPSEDLSQVTQVRVRALADTAERNSDWDNSKKCRRFKALFAVVPIPTEDPAPPTMKPSEILPPDGPPSPEEQQPNEQTPIENQPDSTLPPDEEIYPEEPPAEEGTESPEAPDSEQLPSKAPPSADVLSGQDGVAEEPCAPQVSATEDLPQALVEEPTAEKSSV